MTLNLFPGNLEKMRTTGRSWILLLAAIAFAGLLPFALDLVQILGYKIPIQDRANDYTKAVILSVTLGIIIFGLPVRSDDKKNLLILWMAKSFVCLVVMLFYEWNYGLDAFWYFEKSQSPYSSYGELGFGMGTENIAAALWYFENKILSLGSFHSQKILFSFLGLLAIFIFYRGLTYQVSDLSPRTLLYIGLFPSVLFWSSTLGKDPVNLLGSSLFFYGAFATIRTRNFLFLLSVGAGLLLTASIRTWLVPMLIVPFIIGATISIPSRAVRWLAVIGIVGGLLFGLQQAGRMIAVESVEVLSQVNQVSRSWAYGGSAGYVPQLNSWSAMLQFLPLGMFTALFRPLPGEVLNPFGLLAGLENAAILFLLYVAIRKPARNAWSSPVVIALGSFILIWSMAYAFISPQNLGAAVRFRLQVMPMMIFLLLYVPKAVRPRVISNPRERRNSTEST